MNHGSARDYLQFADSLFWAAGDSDSLLTLAHLEKGAAHVYIRDVATGLDHLSEAYAKLKGGGDIPSLARCLAEIAAAETFRADYETALAYFAESARLFRKAGDTSRELRVLGNRGNLYAQTGQSDSAAAAYERVAARARQLGDSAALLPYYLNYAQLLIAIGNREAARDSLKKAEKLLSRHADESTEGNFYSVKAYLLYSDGDFDGSLEADSAAMQAYRSARATPNLLNPLNRAAMSAESKGDFEAAYRFLQQYASLRDSLRSTERENLIAGAQSRMKLIEKEHEIAVLNTLREGERNRNRLYILLLIFAAATLVLIILRSRKARQVHRLETESMHQRMKLQSLRAEQSEQALKRVSDLLAREALGNIRKNEQLTSLRKGLDELQSEVPAEAAAEVQKLKAGIKHARSEEKIRQEFSALFERVHPEFIAKLNALGCELTEREKRLCALIKVNMDNREIAAVMNIEAGSVKTARYRLRKKLDLSPETSLNAFIHRF